MHWKAVLILFWVGLLAGGRAVLAQAAPRIDRPGEGEAVQGIVSVTGSSAVDGFQSAELAYAYQNGEEGWFLIDQRGAPVNQGELGVWDTTTIADGTYRLRLRVSRSSGEAVEAFVNGVRVRNYTPIETRAPAATQPGATALPATVTPAAAGLLPTPTRLPDNPARLTDAGLASSIVRGAVTALLLFAVLGIYTGLRAWIRR